GIAALVLARLWSIASDVLLKQGVFAYFKARALRLQSSSTEHKERDSELPDEYVREFPLYPVLGEEGSVLVPKSQELDPILAQFRDWKETRRESSLALVGEKGIGKTTLLSTLRPRLAEAEVSFCTLKERLITPADVVSTLAELFGFDDVETLDGLGQRLTEGPDRAVIIDDAHLSFLRVVDGYRGFEALVQLVNQTGKQVFWILSFNDLAWSFLNAAHGGRAYFRRMQRMTRWSAEELRDLLGRRTKKAGYELEFDEQLMDEQGAGESGIRLIEGAEGFFRLLWESSRGNPRAATWQWLRALTPIGDQRVRVQLFASKKVEALSRASDDVYFALASIAQHENLDETELQATLNVDPSFAGFVLRYLTEYGVVGPKFGAENRYTLKVRHYRD
ncbi:MAG: ATP-binding protein, partial [Myxococcota bacterium]